MTYSLFEAPDVFLKTRKFSNESEKKFSIQSQEPEENPLPSPRPAIMVQLSSENIQPVFYELQAKLVDNFELRFKDFFKENFLVFLPRIKNSWRPVVFFCLKNKKLFRPVVFFCFGLKVFFSLKD